MPDYQDKNRVGEYGFTFDGLEAQPATPPPAREDDRIERVCDGFAHLFDALDVGAGDEPGTTWEDRSHVETMDQNPPAPEVGADATAELAHYAEKYRDTRIEEQFDLLLIHAKIVAAKTGNASLTTSEIEWLYRSVRRRLSATPPPGMVMNADLQQKAARTLDRMLVEIDPDEGEYVHSGRILQCLADDGLCIAALAAQQGEGQGQ